MAKSAGAPIRMAEDPSANDGNVLQSGGGGGTMDGMNERVIRLEERTDLFAKQLDRIVTRLDAMDEKLERRFAAMDEKLATLTKLPSKEFLIGTIISALAIALAIAALTFAIADYAAKKATPASPVAAPVAAPQQPLVIVVPSLSALPQAVTPQATPPEVAPSPAKP
jgi:hypothetical protein